MGCDLRLRFQRGDIWAVALVLLLAAAVALAFLPGGSEASGGMVQIYRDGELLHRLSLNAETTLEIAGDYTNEITVSGGRAAITRSDCPGEDCVHSGWISAAGRSIVCLPNRVEVRISGAQDEVDFVVGVM